MLAPFPNFDYRDSVALVARLQQLLPPEHWLALQTVRVAAQEAGQPVYLVGGIVRDLLLGRPNLDLDFVCLQPARTLAQLLLPRFEKLPAIAQVKLTEHIDFGTARLDLTFTNAQILHLDFATSRREIYSQPAALPTVDPVPVPLEIDLQRRDFTINALALSFSEGLIDPFKGVEDLKQGWLRVLHDRSFEDDPTRMVRGVRFAARFGYRFEPHTEALLKAAVVQGFFNLLTPERKRNELALLLSESQPEIGLALLQVYDLLSQIHPLLDWNAALAQSFGQLQAYLTTPPSVAAYLAALLHLNSSAQVEALIKDLGFWGDTAKVPVAVAQLWQQVRPQLNPDLKNSQLYALLHPYQAPPEILTVFQALLFQNEPQKAAQVSYYRQNLAELRPQLGGDFLKNELGLKPGPYFKVWLSQLHNAVLDGTVQGRAGEEAFLRSLAAKPN